MDFEELTDELLLEVFLSFDASTLLSCSLVNKRWFHVAHTQQLWQELVLKTWPSQYWLYSKVPLHCMNWYLIYKEFTENKWYTADEMKYFTFSSTIEHEPVSGPLREVMYEKIESIKKKWTKFEPQDHNEDAVHRYFNTNMELLFDTEAMNWMFYDKHRGYKHRVTQSSKFVVRPYQVIPSCLVLYRWLLMFPSFATAEPGLTFYRIWRFRLKHVQTGMVFELCDWKAAMSSTFSHGKPMIYKFLVDAIELLHVITHPHFIMRPQGIHPRLERTFNYVIKAAAGGSIFKPHKRKKTFKQNKRSPLVPRSPIGKTEIIFGRLPDNEKTFPDIDERLERWRERRRRSLMPPQFDAESNSNSSYVTSDTEMETSTEEKETAASSDCDSEFNGYEYGYVTNCEYYISSSHNFESIEEQHSLQASIADNWMFTEEGSAEKQPVLFDIDDESWYFQSERGNRFNMPKYFSTTKSGQHSQSQYLRPDQNIIGNAMEKLKLELPAERFVPESQSMTPAHYYDCYSNLVEAIPSALALYRLICLFEVDCSMYQSFEEGSVWNLTVMHKKTGGRVNLGDYNGMFQVFVSTSEITDRLLLQTTTIEPSENNSNAEDDNIDKSFTPRATSSAPQDDIVSEKVDLKIQLTEFRAAVTQLLDLLMSEDFSHPYGTIAGAVA